MHYRKYIVVSCFAFFLFCFLFCLPAVAMLHQPLSMEALSSSRLSHDHLFYLLVSYEYESKHAEKFDLRKVHELNDHVKRILVHGIQQPVDVLYLSWWRDMASRKYRFWMNHNGLVLKKVVSPNHWVIKKK